MGRGAPTSSTNLLGVSISFRRGNEESLGGMSVEVREVGLGWVGLGN